MPIAIHQGDAMEWARRYDGPPFHAFLSDMPYHLTEITKRFGGPDAAEPVGDVYGRAARGFMGQTWDGGDFAFRPETWAALAGPMHPGAFGMAFAGSRGWHRMAVAIEDAGLIIHPTIFAWAYGSGFPKATRIDRQVEADAFRAWLGDHPEEAERLRALRARERAARRERSPDASALRVELLGVTAQLQEAAGLRRVAGTRKHAPKFAAAEHGYREKDNGYNSRERESFDVLAPATALSAVWEAFRYGGQVLKPAVEPIVMFQKPYPRGRPVDSILRTGAGAVWVDGGRIGTAEDTSRRPVPVEGVIAFGRGLLMGGQGHEGGRWPSNLLLSHHPACSPAGCDPQCRVEALGRQSGETSLGHFPRSASHGGIWGRGLDPKLHDTANNGHDDSGTAARYFYAAGWEAEQLEAAETGYLPPWMAERLGEAVLYYPKPSSAEKEAGLDPDQIALMRELYPDEDLPDGEAETVGDGRETPIDNAYQRGMTERRNTHPTIKPLSVARHLATLLLPPPSYGPRRLLVPCAGTGSEMIGGMLAGWEDVAGVELMADHIPIARARIRYWEQARHRFDAGQAIKVKAPRRPRKGAPAAAEALDMFREGAA